jgi:hypothetical protein
MIFPAWHVTAMVTPVGLALRVRSRLSWQRNDTPADRHEPRRPMMPRAEQTALCLSRDVRVGIVAGIAVQPAATMLAAATHCATT